MRRRLLVLALCFFAVLPASAAITGIVMTTAGQPVAGAKIEIYSLKPMDEVRARLLSDKPDPVPVGSAQSDAKGRFTLDSPADAVVMMRVSAPGYAPDARSIERDEDLGAIALTAAETKTGRITAAGKPVAGARVIFSNGELIATTDAEGRYS
ncbi:MAG TPA: carboxypeptidase regulatory-like domain-containing protein, partial [Thermoanaerobaculia bacterium]|nr:carboxypeptidase regulatory-like domain-containing protein [Thermoanaerobaculia bacterium]